VPHKKLCDKLATYGIQGKTLEWISDFLSNRTQKVLVGGKISDSVDVLSGVPQGTVLGPLLFICYINDLPNTIKSKIRMYADDTLVYSSIDTIDDCIQLQRDLLGLEKWSKIHQMEFNPLKCEFLIVTNKTSPHKFTYHINDVPIKEVNSVKYLGIVIDSKLTWKEHVKQVLSKDNAALSFLRRNLRACSRHIKEQCFKLLCCQ